MLEKYIGMYCPHCGVAFNETDSVAICSDCGAVQHLSCRQSRQQCSTPGCPGTIGEILAGSGSATIVNPYEAPPAPTPEPDAPTVEHIPAPVFAQVVTDEVAARPTAFTGVQSSLAPEAPPAAPVQQPVAEIPVYTPPVQAPVDPPVDPPKKKKKRVGLVITLILLVLLLAGGVVGYIFIGMPYLKYQDAMDALNSNNFENAYRLFSEAGDYQDASQKMVETRYRQAQHFLTQKQYDAAYALFQQYSYYMDSAAMMQETRYLQATDLLAQEKYEEAYTLFEALGNYKDSADKLPEIRYLQAVATMKSGDYAKAEELFTALDDYKDSATQATEARYQRALALLEDGDYQEAMTLLKTISNYEDAQDKILDCKYAYVKDHLDNSDETTYEYLQLLIDEEYKDAEDLYEELYAWKLTITAVNSDPEDTTTNLASISKYDPVYIHIQVSGGTPDDGLKIRVGGTQLDGASIHYLFSGEMKDGSRSWYGWSSGLWIDPDYGYGGILVVEFYDNDTDTLLASTRITIDNY